MRFRPSDPDTMIISTQEAIALSSDRILRGGMLTVNLSAVLVLQRCKMVQDVDNGPVVMWVGHFN